MTSCEPNRRSPYSPDLRWRIVWQRIGMEQDFRSIAANLNIAVSTAHRVYTTFEQTGNVDSKVREYTAIAIDERVTQAILAVVFDCPDLYLTEITDKVHDCTGVKVSPSAVCNTIYKNGLTRKKMQRIAEQRSAIHRGDYLAEISMYNTNMLVFADETGKDSRDSIRRYGYAIRGEVPHSTITLTRGTRISTIAAISCSGLICYDKFTGNVSGDEFYDFVRGSLIPNMNPYNGTNENSILVLDNCSIHYIEETLSLLRTSGIFVIFLPPYSPDLNPIELTFSYVKQYLQEHEAIIQAANNISDVITSAFDNITINQCTNWIHSCGYS
ncbi:uncharacterized protein [Dysidea avara]|uniref:uncharacterized protein n=1 Tax=Dysidea avara TaxID=196820 RepID=UPI0033219B5C